jgi:hypothetical protein
MLILKHVEFAITDIAQLENLLEHLKETTSQKKEFVLFLDCDSEKKYLAWRKICPPPPGAKDWYQILFTKEEHFSPKYKM